MYRNLNDRSMKLKILFLEDRDDDVELVSRTLNKADVHFELKQVDTREEFEQALKSYNPHVILSDHALPQFNSSEALTICQHHGLQAPFILVTGTVSEEFAVRCLKQGADDYILKGNLARLPSAIRNALDKRKAEYAKEQLIQELKAKNDQLFEANHELHKINQELDAFVYSVSHNLRAPLLSVLGLLNLSKHEVSAGNVESLSSYHGMMESSIKKLDETLKGILDYSRNARKDLVIEVIELEEQIKEIFSKLKFIPGSESIKFSIKNSSSDCLLSDRYRLDVVLTNLLSNAIKYRDLSKSENTIDVKITITASVAEVTLMDNGIGIDPEHVHKIFDVFVRATEKAEGAGLGLFLVKENLDKLGGSISVTSELSKGTSFTIKIPNNKH